MQLLFPELVASLTNGQPVIRASIVTHSGSTPRKSGSMMLIFPTGNTLGTIGGGGVEATVIATAETVLQTETSQLLPFDLTNTDAAEIGMVCGGELTVFVEYVEPTAHNIALYSEAIHLMNSGEHCSLVSHIAESGEHILSTILSVHTDPSYIELPEHITHAALQNISTLQSVLCLTDKNNIFFIEPVAPQTVLHFIGAGHVAQATAELASLSGFSIKVTDDRAEFANNKLFPTAHAITVLDSLDGEIPFKRDTTDYIIIMTRGHLHDKHVLAQALKTSSPYIGMIGSRKKKAATYQLLQSEGITQNQLNKVHCPIGLGIGANTPHEIAISILGEIIQHRQQTLTKV